MSPAIAFASVPTTDPSQEGIDLDPEALSSSPQLKQQTRSALARRVRTCCGFALRDCLPWFAALGALVVILQMSGALTPPPLAPSCFSSSLNGTRRANATIVMLVNPESDPYISLLPTLRNIEDRFNRRLGYPIQLLTNGVLPSRAVQSRTDYITGGKAFWSLITKEQGWGPPAWVAPQQIESSISKIGFTVGYRSMCRFFSVFLADHPSVAPFDWIFRLDEGITFHCDLQKDPFLAMIDRNASYGYTITTEESPHTIHTLWSTTKNFIAQAPQEYFPRDNELSFVLNDEGENYNLRMYYNNFEIIRRSFLTSPAYRAYSTALDQAGGFFIERWGDAPIRTIAASLFLRKDEIHSFSSVSGYEHWPASFECPDVAWCSCQPH